MKKLTVAIEKLLAVSGRRPFDGEIYTDSFIDDYEAKIGIKIQTAYRELLKKVSHVFWGTIELLDMTEAGDSRCELSVALSEARKLGLPHDWLPISEDNGDYYCLLPNGTVRFWAHDGATEEEWENLSEWIEEIWIKGN